MKTPGIVRMGCRSAPLAAVVSALAVSSAIADTGGAPPGHGGAALLITGVLVVGAALRRR